MAKVLISLKMLTLEKCFLRIQESSSRSDYKFHADKLPALLQAKLKIEQSHYTDQDLRFAFGAIDILDFEVDFAARTIHAWFQDRYEWHPVYPGFTRLSG